MRKVRTRVFSILLTCAMLLSLLPITALAGDGDENGEVITDFGEFLKKVEDAGYNYDGKGITVKWSPSSACTYDRHADHPDECLFGTATRPEADGNTPQRVQEPNAQYQIFDGQHDVSVSNVNFVFEPADYTLCMNSGWKGTTTADKTRNAELQLLNSGDVTFKGCTFDKVIVGSYLDGGSTANGTTTTFDTCKFMNAYDAYAVKDVYSTNLVVTNCGFDTCGGGIHLTGGLDKGIITITDNTFANMDTYAVAEKVGTRGLIQFSDAGDYSSATITISDNSSTGDAAVLRQLNSTISRDTIVGILEAGGNSFAGAEVFTSDSFTANVELPDGSISWGENTVYDGTNYYPTMDAALDGIHQEDIHTLWCKPGADVGTMTHGHVCADLTIYGNGAYVSAGEHDFELDTYDDEAGHAVGTYLTQDVDLTIYDLNGCAVWGQRNSNYTLNITLENCKNMNRVYLSGTSGTNNITLKNCSFDSTRTDALKASSCTVYSNAPGTITLENCAFTSVQEPINLNNKADAGTTQTINVINCTFTDCSTADICTNDVTWAAPIRIVSSAGAVSNLNVNGCDFVYGSGKASVNGDILLGDGREGDDKASYPVYANISGTNAEVQIQNPGDRTSNANNAQKISVTSSEGETNLTNAVARINDKDYMSLADAISAAMTGTNKTVTLLSDITANSWDMIWNITGITLDGDGHTIKVNDIQSGQNHDAVFHSLGGNTFKDLTVDLSGVTAGSLAQGSRAFSAAPGDSFSNVTVIGNEHVSYGITVGGTDTVNETVTIDGCHFEDLGYAVYDSESAGVENLIIKNSTMTDCGYAVILHSENAQFTGNIVDSGKLNIMSDKQIVTNNTFTDGSRIKFYSKPAAFEKNKISMDSKLDANTGVTGIDVSENYWGGGAPSSDQLNDVNVTGSDVYYEKPTMKDEDLNTYVPPYTGGTTAPSGDYLINVDRTTGGKVTVNPGRADKGDTVTITVKPNDGYVLDELTVTAKDGGSVKLTWKDDNKYTFTMPGSQVSIEASFVKEGGQVVTTLPFADVTANDWYYDAVQYVYENDLMNGTSATAFSPFVTTSRAMILTILARYDGVDTSAGSTWYEAGAVWAIAEGVSDGTNLEANLTREQLVTMLWRYAGSPVVEGDLADYPDSASVSDWAVNAMIWAVENGVITGNGAGALNPQGTATRAEVATILMRFIEN